MKRNEFFKKGIPSILNDFLDTPIGNILDTQLQKFSNLLAPEWLSPEETTRSAIRMKSSYPRPPGAIEERLFRRACTECNDCMIACPHGTLFRINGLFGPVLDPNLNACRLCEEYPCIGACETGALKKLPKRALPQFGSAFVDPALCRNAQESENGNSGDEGMCELCKNGCPVDGVVDFTEEMIPSITKWCTGCGICSMVCPASAIEIRWEEEP